MTLPATSIPIFAETRLDIPEISISVSDDVFLYFLYFFFFFFFLGGGGGSSILFGQKQTLNTRNIKPCLKWMCRLLQS